MRQPARDGSDPGAIEEAWFIVADGMVRLTDRNGTPLHGEENANRLRPGENAKEIAGRLLRKKSRARANKPFNRPLRYPRLAY
jgi:hypothetical protein